MIRFIINLFRKPSPQADRPRVRTIIEFSGDQFGEEQRPIVLRKTG